MSYKYDGPHSSLSRTTSFSTAGYRILSIMSVVNGTSKKLVKEPLKYSGSLDGYKFFESTPVIGREYVDLKLMDLLKAPDADQQLKDLAITSSFPFRSCVRRVCSGNS